MKKWLKLNISRGAKITIMASIAVSIVGFAEKKQSERTSGDVYVDITNHDELKFVDKEDVASVIHKKEEKNAIEGFQGANTLKHLETEVNTNAYIKEAQVHRDLLGNLKVTVVQSSPLVRVLLPGNDVYLSKEAEVLPVSPKYTPRVMLLSGLSGRMVAESGSKFQDAPGIMPVLHFIDKDEFWRSQIAQVSLQPDGELYFYPQVSKQQVEFGAPNDIETKFKKLKIFYTKVLPFKGWNYYDRVCLKYKGQIVCE